MTISNEEKIKELIGQESLKRSEIQKAKEELEKKKKEIELLEKKKIDEISAARKEIQSKIEEMVIEEQKDYLEQEELRNKKEKNITKLEEKIDTTNQQTTTSNIRSYGDAINEVLRGQPTFYNLTDYNVINRLELIAKEAATRPLTTEESAFVNVVRYEAASMIQNQDYNSRQGANYLRQELRQIDRIVTLSKQRDDEMRKTDYNV